jgi:hypothetical protein
VLCERLGCRAYVPRICMVRSIGASMGHACCRDQPLCCSSPTVPAGAQTLPRREDTALQAGQQAAVAAIDAVVLAGRGADLDL